MLEQDEFITEFLDADTVSALPIFISQKDNYNDSADKIACAFGAASGFSAISNDNDATKKLLTSFKNNLTLLIQKTWVEKSDIALKDSLLIELDKLLSDDQTWLGKYSLFLEIINQAVFLMFGQSTDSPDFAEYSIRIDPEFGIFWWYISSLPASIDWSEEKCKLAMLIGMYFLANY